MVTTTASSSGFAPTLQTARLTLLRCDISNPLHVELNLVLLHDPAFQANFGDFGIRTHADVIRLMNVTSITPDMCPKLLSKPTAAAYIMCLKDIASDDEDTSDESRLRSQDPALAFPSPYGKMIGMITLGSRGRSVPPDMGWGLFCQYANRGFATEAGKEALRYWRDDCGISEIIAWPKETNIPSVRTAAKLGFVENGLVVDMADGSRHAVYTLPGMKKFEEGTKISFWGEDEKGKPDR